MPRSACIELRWTIVFSLAVCALATGEPPAASQPVDAAVPVAVLDFAASVAGQPELGGQIAEFVAARLSDQPGIRLVERGALTRALTEMELSLSGVVDESKTVKVGRLVGAKLIVTGRAFALGEKQMLTAKLIGTETSLVKVVSAEGAANSDLGALALSLADKLAESIRTDARSLMAEASPAADRIASLQAKLKARKLPVIAVHVSETHVSRAVIDPAVETEIRRVLIDSGFEVRAVSTLSGLPAGVLSNQPWPKALDGIDLVVMGEALSEFGARLGNLQSCGARAEITLLSRDGGRVLLSERATARHIDLEEHLAAKAALEKCGRALSERLLAHFDASLPSP